jgi:hypothetical protein
MAFIARPRPIVKQSRSRSDAKLRYPERPIVESPQRHGRNRCAETAESGSASHSRIPRAFDGKHFFLQLAVCRQCSTEKCFKQVTATSDFAREEKRRPTESALASGDNLEKNRLSSQLPQVVNDAPPSAATPAK